MAPSSSHSRSFWRHVDIPNMLEIASPSPLIFHYAALAIAYFSYLGNSFPFLSILQVRSRVRIPNQDLASSTPILESQNEEAVRLLYDALSSGDARTVQSILAPDLEWWFHGPPDCEYLMRLLTGLSRHTRFSFQPENLTAVGDKVFVEGNLGKSLYWIHVWTVKNGIATEVREYFNTSLVVTDFNTPSAVSSSSSGKSSVCCPLWQSELGKSDGESMPGLVLAI